MKQMKLEQAIDIVMLSMSELNEAQLRSIIDEAEDMLEKQYNEVRR